MISPANSTATITRIVDGGYLSWSYGAIGFKAWSPMRKSYTRQSGTLICFDSDTSERKRFFPAYKSHRADKRLKRSHIHEKVLVFQSVLREDPSLHLLEVPGLEADDLVALIAARYALPVTAIDKDLLQITGVELLRLDGSQVSIDHFATRQAVSVMPYVNTPADILLTLTLLGDKSDDIPRLIPPRNLSLFVKIMNHSSPWKMAYQLFKDRLLTNLSLAVLPSPWVFDHVPTPIRVFELVLSGEYHKQSSCLPLLKPQLVNFFTGDAFHDVPQKQAS